MLKTTDSQLAEQRIRIANSLIDKLRVDKELLEGELELVKGHNAELSYYAETFRFDAAKEEQDIKTAAEDAIVNDQDFALTGELDQAEDFASGSGSGVIDIE